MSSIWRDRSRREGPTGPPPGCEHAVGDECRCRTAYQGNQLVVDARKCGGRGRLAERPSCRATVVEALVDRDAALVSVHADDVERAYGRDGAAFLLAAGRFAERGEDHDAALAAVARRDPFSGARLAAGRSAPIARIAAETGFIEGAVVLGGYERAFGTPSSDTSPGLSDRDGTDDGQ